MIITVFCLLWILYLLFDYQFCLLYLCFHLWVIWGTALSMNVCKIFITSVNFTMLCKITGMFHHVLQVYHSISPCYARLLIYFTIFCNVWILFQYHCIFNKFEIPHLQMKLTIDEDWSLVYFTPCQRKLSEKLEDYTDYILIQEVELFKSNWTVEDIAREFHISFCFNLSTMMNKQVFWGGSFRGLWRNFRGFPGV